MRFSGTMLLAALLAVSACGGSGADDSAADEAVANLDAENFSVTLNSDDVGLNEVETRQLNVATE